MKSEEHYDISDKARTMYVENGVAARFLGLEGLSIYYEYFRYMMNHEDDGTNWMCHFWDPDGGPDDGLFVGFDSCYRRAEGFYLEDSDTVFDRYWAGQVESAYNRLGAIGHLVSDLGTPAHVLNDPHPLYDWYEFDYITVSSNHLNATFDAFDWGTSLYALMYALAEDTDNFSTPDYDGDVYSRYDLYNFYTIPPDATEIFESAKPGVGAVTASVAYRGAIGHVAGLLRLFYNDVRPYIADLSGTCESYRGSQGISLNMTGNVRGVLGFCRGSLWYSTAGDRPNMDDESAWSALSTSSVINPDGSVLFNLAAGVLNSFNHRVWLRGRIWDANRTESALDAFSYCLYIDVDSTPPKISVVSIES